MSSLPRFLAHPACFRSTQSWDLAPEVESASLQFLPKTYWRQVTLTIDCKPRFARPPHVDTITNRTFDFRGFFVGQAGKALRVGLDAGRDGATSCRASSPEVIHKAIHSSKRPTGKKVCVRCTKDGPDRSVRNVRSGPLLSTLNDARSRMADRFIHWPARAALTQIKRWLSVGWGFERGWLMIASLEHGAAGCPNSHPRAPERD